MESTETPVRFRHERIDDRPPAGQLSTCTLADLTGNGRPDVIVSALGAYPEVTVGGTTIKVRQLPGADAVLSRLETNVFWYENPGWERHALSTEPGLHLDVGATVHDVDGDGRIDYVAGQGFDCSDVYWFRQPEDPREPWDRFLVTDRFQKYHDLLVGDVDNDGDPELLGLSQEAEAIFYYDIPEDPTVEPWPEANCHVIDEGVVVEGAWIGDLDGDGENELIAGPNVYRREDGEWTREEFAPGWHKTRVAVADLDGDGDLEVLLSEGDSPLYGDAPGRVGWFDPPDWEPQLLHDGMFCPHSLQVGDVTGDGRPDVYAAEMGHRENDDPQHFLFVNEGDGRFERYRIDTDVPVHEAKLADVDGDGDLDIVGKPYTPHRHVDVWYGEPN